MNHLSAYIATLALATKFTYLRVTHSEFNDVSSVIKFELTTLTSSGLGETTFKVSLFNHSVVGTGSFSIPGFGGTSASLDTMLEDLKKMVAENDKQVWDYLNTPKTKMELDSAEWKEACDFWKSI